MAPPTDDSKGKRMKGKPRRQRSIEITPPANKKHCTKQKHSRVNGCSSKKEHFDVKSTENDPQEPANVLENDIFTQIFHSKGKVTLPADRGSTGIRVVNPICERSNNLVHWRHLQTLGRRGHQRLKQGSDTPVTSLVQSLKLCRTASPFTKRCTAVEWHPTNPSLVAIGAKAGDAILWNIDHINQDLFIPEVQAGLSISCIKFHPNIQTKIYTTTLGGLVCLQDFVGVGQHTQVFCNTHSIERWYCSLDTSQTRSQMVAGDNQGNVTFLTMDGKLILEKKLHKQKVTHTEYSTREDWLMITSSVDRTVKVWDIRMIQDRNSCLETLEHEKPINSAYFSLTDGYRLLTTDQHSQIRIYNTATWRLERTITHPHRTFQHLTAIKAHWHPLQDLIVIGRYPDHKLPAYTEGERRTIDVFDAGSGEIVAQLYDPNAPGIVSLNKFNPQGDMLASAMGVNILLWKRPDDLEESQTKLMSSMKESGIHPDLNSRRRQPKQNKQHMDKLAQQKLADKIQETKKKKK